MITESNADNMNKFIPSTFPHVSVVDPSSALKGTDDLFPLIDNKILYCNELYNPIASMEFDSSGNGGLQEVFMDSPGFVKAFNTQGDNNILHAKEFIESTEPEETAEPQLKADTEEKKLTVAERAEITRVNEEAARLKREADRKKKEQEEEEKKSRTADDIRYDFASRYIGATDQNDKDRPVQNDMYFAIVHHDSKLINGLNTSERKRIPFNV